MNGRIFGSTSVQVSQTNGLGSMRRGPTFTSDFWSLVILD